MCGFAGFFRPVQGLAEDSEAILLRMTRALQHRGPDSEGYWVDSEGGIAMGHRRLAVVDLSSAGHQPMVSASGRYVLAFNGEIYDHLTLRQRLAGSGIAPTWRGLSDTETLLAGFEHWGVEPTLQRVVGMFAFALWDRQSRCLTLGRDRLGEKPLYYGWQNGVFLFGSELKSLKLHPAFEHQLDRNALAGFMQLGAVPGESAIYQGIRKLRPGHVLRIFDRGAEVSPTSYWSLDTSSGRLLQTDPSDAPGGMEQQLEALMLQAVGQQMVADVPLGAFLSGGVDSSLVTALMQAQSTRPVRTFTVGFEELAYSEAAHARAVANHLGTEHTELLVSAQDAMEVIPRLPRIYCEPFADSSQIPTLLVSQLARQHVTVSLSGDGADELFGGYNRYVSGEKLWRGFRRMPPWARQMLARGVLAAPVAFWAGALRPARRWLPAALQSGDMGERLHKSAALMRSASADELYMRLISHWEPASEVVLGADHHRVGLGRLSCGDRPEDFVNAMMAEDLRGYLPDDILTKVDRAAMAVSLETRVPFLDHRVVEFAWGLPLQSKVRGGLGKWPLRQILYKYVPRALIERPKMGFGVPLESWLRGPLRPWAEALLDESRLRREGYLDPALIRQRWSEHVAGRRNWQHALWNVLMFQAWLEVQ